MSFFGKYYFARNRYTVGGDADGVPDLMDVSESWQPPVDVYEKGKRVVVLVSLAGVKPKDLEVRMTGTELVIRGMRCDRSPGSGKKYRQMEIHHGSFERVISLPAPVTNTGASASLRDGLLEIVMPLATRTRRASAVIRVDWIIPHD